MKITNNIKKSSDANKKELVKQTNFKRRYYFTEYDLVVPSPMFRILEENKLFLLENAATIRLEASFYFRPDLVCYYTWGDPGLYFLLLFVNDMFSFIDFKVDTIKLPVKSKVLNVISRIESSKIFANIDAEVTL